MVEIGVFLTYQKIICILYTAYESQVFGMGIPVKSVLLVVNKEMVNGIVMTKPASSRL